MDTAEEKKKSIALGKCVSPLTVEKCPYCVDTCEAFHWKIKVDNLIKYGKK